MKKGEIENKAILLKGFLQNLKQHDSIIEEWDDSLWNVMVEKAIVHHDKTITFILYNGTEVTK